MRPNFRPRPMDIENELNQHYFATLRAIETGRVDAAVRRLEAYVEFAEAYLDAAAKRGVTFPPEAAQSISLLSWNTLDQIIRNANQATLSAIKSGNDELLQAAAQIPLQFMQMSLKKKDFLFYKEMSRVYPAILRESYSMVANSNRERVMDRAWRYLHDFADYVLPEISATYDIETRLRFIRELIWVFGDLMKVTQDHSDADTYAIIGREMNSLFQYLKIAKLSEQDKEPMERFIREERLLVWFGLGAWIIRSFVLRESTRRPGQPNQRIIMAGSIRSFMDTTASNFSNISQLAGAYVKAVSHSYNTSRWVGWLIETYPVNQIHFMDITEWLNYFYVVCGLRLSKIGNPTADDIPKPFRDLQFMMADIRKKVEQVRADEREWREIIHKIPTPDTVDAEYGAEADNVPVTEGGGKKEDGADNTFWSYFLAANEAAVRQWKARREHEIMVSPIDTKLVSQFKEGVIKGWNERAWIVKILKDMGQFEERPAEKEDKYLAIRMRVPKEAFIASNDAPYIGLGYDQGAMVSRDTSERLLSLIEKQKMETIEIETGALMDGMNRIINDIGTEKECSVAFIRGDYELEKRIIKAPGFSPRWQQQNPRYTFPEYIGDLDRSAIFFLLGERITRITIADLTRLGKLVWFVPEENNVEGLLVRVNAIDESEAGSLVVSQPQYLKNADGTIRTPEMAIRDLVLNVTIFVGVRIEFEVSQSPAITGIKVL